jgi:hypothetical protein
VTLLPSAVGRLDLRNKLLQPELRAAVAAVQRGDRVPAPVVVELDPTSFCDSACPECISQHILGTTRFTRERLSTLALELVEAGVRAVVLIGGGEPLAHLGIDDLMDDLDQGGLQVGLTTSGTLLLQHEAVVARSVTWTRISLDAATPASYLTLRPHRSGRNYFDTVLRGVASLAASARVGSVGISFVIIGRPDSPPFSNIPEISAAGQLARDLGCDYFEVKPAYDLAHFLVPLDEGELLSLQQQLDDVAALATPSFEVISPVTLSAILDSQAAEPKGYQTCRVAELRTLVTSSGAYVCPYHRSNPLAHYGDPVTTSFSELWNGLERQRVKQGLNPNRDCTFHCVRHNSNLVLLDANLPVRGRADVSTVPDLFI